MFERLTIQVEEVRDLGESVLVLGRFTVTGRATNIEFDTEVGQLVTFRDGKIATVHDYLSHSEALEAAGLQE
jgi:ketosteroid isomerase-like protein